MSELQESYNACQQVARASGSNFYRAFDFLRLDRRLAMTALYAFSRLADDATDGPTQNPHSITNQGPYSSDAWCAQDWLKWVDQLDQPTGANPHNDFTKIESLEAIRAALVDSMQRFQFTKQSLEQIVLGVDQDTRPVRIERYDQLQAYMYRVASAVGLSCIAIWSSSGVPNPGTQAFRMAVDCGHAFQLTNILRDLAEDSLRQRMYLADEDLLRFGFQRDSLIESLQIANPSERCASVRKLGNWPELIRLYSQRAAACYASGWGVSSIIEPDALRMFSMIWNTYHQIFQQVHRDPWAPLLKRPSLDITQKIGLYSSHAFTPWFRSLTRPAIKKCYPSTLESNSTPKVAIVGGGLAGIQTAMHLAKHGCETWLIESRSRLGGRVGSFTDPKTDQPIDYCQHVGMRCCKELVRWINDVGQENHWQEQSTLWFRSRNGKPFRAAAWPLPAPLHLSGLLLQWPDLSPVDRARIAWALIKLIRTRPSRAFEQQMALDWLNKNHQSKNAIDCYWNTILVSALGDQLARITMGSVHKVIIDGFAATKDAYHLLVPQKSLSELVDETSKECLNKLGVRLLEGRTVTGLSRNHSGTWQLQTRNLGDSIAQLPDFHAPDFHAAVLAVPWHRLGSVLDHDSMPDLPNASTLLNDVQQLQSAPITGIHTWWSKKWFNDPHAILIDRLCQWIFPGPEDTNTPKDSTPKEHYYQIVISGSRDLPKGDPDAILRLVEADLREVFPELRDSGAIMTRGKVITDPQSVFSVDAGHQRARLGSGTFGNQGIFLAGDWTATGWPATMEGALRSGSLAASEVLSYLGRPADVSVDG